LNSISWLYITKRWCHLAREAMPKKPRVAYVVVRGRKPGIYYSWSECNAQVSGFSGNSYMGYNNEGDAEKAWEEYLLNNPLTLQPNDNLVSGRQTFQICDEYGSDVPVLVGSTVYFTNSELLSV
jgi:hypothetical protein